MHNKEPYVFLFLFLKAETDSIEKLKHYSIYWSDWWQSN